MIKIVIKHDFLKRSKLSLRQIDNDLQSQQRYQYKIIDLKYEF